MIGVSFGPEKATALQACSTTRSVFITYCFTGIELQWHSVRQCPGVIRLVRIGGDEPVHVPDEVIDALRKRERDGAIDLPTKPRRKNPESLDR